MYMIGCLKFYSTQAQLTSNQKHKFIEEIFKTKHIHSANYVIYIFEEPFYEFFF